MTAPISRRKFLEGTAAGVAASALGPWLARPAGAESPPAASAAPRPNIVFFLIDDLGWGDVGYHGSDIKTPVIDNLAASGVRLEQFYAQPLCTPTRAALMTGRYPFRHGLQVDVIYPWSQFGLPLEERTLAQALREAGYETAICGKWHLGHFRREYLPTARGFDHQYGLYYGAMDYFTHMREGTTLDWHRDDRACREEGYSTFLLADEAVRIIRGRDRAKPLFLYVPFNAVHDPYQAPPKYAEPYANREEPRRTYAGMVAAMDEAIGRVMAAVDEQGLRRDTLIIFSSDNGGVRRTPVGDNGRYRAGKATVYEGGVRVAAFASWQGRIKPGTVVNEPLHMVDWYPTVLKLAGASLEQKLPLDGRDAWPAIAEGKPSPHEEIVLNAAPRGGAILVGQWKLVIASPVQAKSGAAPKGPATQGEQAADRVELFNLATDPGEQEDLAAKHPEKVRDLRARYEALARQAVPPKAHPKPPDYQPPKVSGEPE
jgi:arylsulfatase A-like enzyme